MNVNDTHKKTWVRRSAETIRALPNLVEFLPLFLTMLPERFQWTVHNVVAHPAGEILYQMGFEDLGSKVHDITVPASSEGRHDS